MTTRSFPSRAVQSLLVCEASQIKRHSSLCAPRYGGTAGGLPGSAAAEWWKVWWTTNTGSVCGRPRKADIPAQGSQRRKDVVLVGQLLSRHDVDYHGSRLFCHSQHNPLAKGLCWETPSMDGVSPVRKRAQHRSRWRLRFQLAWGKRAGGFRRL